MRSPAAWQTVARGAAARRGSPRPRPTDAGAAAPAEAAGAAEADAAAARGFLACALLAGLRQSAGAIASTGTTSAAQSVLSQRILDPFFRLVRLSEEIAAGALASTLTRRSLFGPLA